MLLFVLSVLFCVRLIYSAGVVDDIKAENIIRGAYLVEFSHTKPLELHEGKSLIYEHLEKRFSNHKVLFRTETKTSLFHGHSFQLIGDESINEDSLMSIPHVISIYRVHKVARPKPEKHVFNPASETTVINHSIDDVHIATGVLDARNKLSLRGSNLKVAVIDSGVDYSHPALGGCFGPGCKVAFGYDFVGDDYDYNNPVAVPDADPIDDCDPYSHGTHVAGIIAADASHDMSGQFVSSFPFTGVAPNATIGAYRVFPCSGDSGDDIIAAAVYTAAADGANVINLSLGGGPDFDGNNPLTVAVTKVSAAGHFVVASAGNDGEVGLLSLDAPSIGSNVFSVASFDNSYLFEITLNVDDVAYPVAYGELNDEFKFPAESLNIIVNDIDTIANNEISDGCSLASIKHNATTTDQTLLLRADFSKCGSNARCSNAAKAGYARCLLYDVDSILSPILGSSEIPSAIISNDAGSAIIASVKAGLTPSVIITNTTKLFPKATGGTISYFSSGGLSEEFAIKPNIGAVGGGVYSTISLHAMNSQNLNSAYSTYYGTSMSSPYVAGCMALLIEGKWKYSSNSNAIKNRHLRSVSTGDALAPSSSSTPKDLTSSSTVESQSIIPFDDELSLKTVETLLFNNAKPSLMYQSSLMNSVAKQGSGLINVYD
eukprot:gene9122-12303_t